jgi:hypothetical protein
MFSGKLVDTIVKHSDDIMRLVIKRIREDADLKYIGSLSDAELLERGHHILERMEMWLNPARRKSLERDYEELGRRRFEQSVPLHESVRALLLIRSQAIEYVFQQGFDQSSWKSMRNESWNTGWPVFRCAGLPLVKGYEAALRELPTVPVTPRHEPYPFWVP